MRLSAFLALGCALPAFLATAGAGLAQQQGSAPRIDCTCRYKGQDYALGAMVCLSGPGGPQMARCGMVLNNTSWQFTGLSCTLSQAIDGPGLWLAMSARPAPASVAGHAR